MRALIVVEHHRSNPTSFLVSTHAVALLETLPGVSEVRVEYENSVRATISYDWRDPGVHSQGMAATFLSEGMKVVSTTRNARDDDPRFAATSA